LLIKRRKNISQHNYQRQKKTSRLSLLFSKFSPEISPSLEKEYSPTNNHQIPTITKKRKIKKKVGIKSQLKGEICGTKKYYP